MKPETHPFPLFRLIAASLLVFSFHAVVDASDRIKIVLVAGSIKKADRPGHHDYTGGCRLLKNLLEQNSGVTAILVKGGWPKDETVFENANSIVFYSDGAGKQAYLQTPQRVALIQKRVDQGVGIVNIHQAVEFPPQYVRQSVEWTGEFYSRALSGRGHWDSAHESFPDHPVTNGVTPWKIKDGWLNRIQFPGGMKGITPLVWSGKQHQGSPAGGDPDIVAWVYQRKKGGRSFSFSGLDAHSAWEKTGMRQLLVNGILWSAGVEIPAKGANCTANKDLIHSFQTPREPPAQPEKKKPKHPTAAR